jgi:hypothetical protein
MSNLNIKGGCHKFMAKKQKPKKLKIAAEERDDGYFLKLGEYEIELHPNIYAYLKSHKQGDFHDIIEKAINVGLLTAQHGKIQNALNLFNDKLYGEFALVQAHMATLKHQLEKDSKFKTDQEFLFRDHLRTYSDEMKRADESFEVTGTSSEKGKNKTGDVLASIKTGTETVNIAIESKLASTFTKGNSRNANKGSLRGKGDTAYMQIFESRKNRDATICIFVIETNLNPFPGPPIEYFAEPLQGFIVRVDIESGDLSNLSHAYEIARTMALSQRVISDPEKSTIEFLIGELQNTLKRKKYIENIGAKTISIITKSNDNLLSQVESELKTFDAELLGLQKAIDLTMNTMTNYLKSGEITAEEALELYQQAEAQTLYDAKKLEWGKQSSDDVDSDGTESTQTYTEAGLKKMSKAELVAIAEEKDLATKGTKAELIARILE